MGVGVRFDERAVTASTDGHTITLPYVSHPITQADLDKLYGFVIHECGHHLRPKAFDILRAANPPQHLACLYNVVEDDGMERERALEYAGDAKALGTMNNTITRELTEEWKKVLAAGALAGVEQDPAPLAAMLIGQLSRLNWDDESATSIGHLVRELPKDVRDLSAELESEGWVDKFRATTNEKATWNVAVDLAKRLYPENDQEKYEEIREAGNKAAEGGSGNQPRDVSADKQWAKGEEGNPKDGSAAPPPSNEIVSWRDVIFSKHEDNKDLHPGGVTIDWAGWSDRSKTFVMPTNKINVIDLGKSRATTTESDEKISWYSGGNNINNYMPTDSQARAFANRIRRYIQSMARSIVQKEKYHGRIDKGSIIRLALPPIDGGEYNKRIFYDQRKHTMKDTAIFVLTDWSGSMMGDKMQYAADASQRLVHTFERVLNVPVALAAFTDGNSDCDIGYIKPFNTRGMPAKEIATRFAKFYHHTSGNNDSDAVHWAWQQLLKRKESRKILIVLSDGAPTDSWRGHAHENLKFMTKTIEKDKRVELYGVGIMSDCVRHYYTNHQVVQKPEDINTALFTLLKDGYNDYTKRR
jgi:hypothetical protein